MAFNTSTAARWTILSSSAVTPSGLCRPSALGIYTLRTGFARYAPRFSLSERSWRSSPAPRRSAATSPRPRLARLLLQREVRFPHRHNLCGTADPGCRRDTGGSGRSNRGCPRHHCNLRARRRRCADGDVFLACKESGARSLHREAILSGKASRTSLTRGYTGRLARGIHNQLLEEMNRPGVAVLPYPLQRALMRNLAVPAQQAGRSEFLALWAGQSAGLAQYPDVATLLQSLVNGVSETLA
jgi:Nitronate monooxygenase